MKFSIKKNWKWYFKSEIFEESNYWY
jgi:hypothetical protein